jgi:type 1 glutamine amidotransferase
MAKALVTWGGWDGHQPDKVSALFAGDLRAAGFEVELTDSLACFDDAARLAGFDLIVPVWTMSTITMAGCAMRSATTRCGSS